MPFRTGLSLLFLAGAALPLMAADHDEFFETLPDGTRPPVVVGAIDAESAFAGAARQSPGSLSGRIVFTSAGHGWTWGQDGWYTQRGVGHEMNEDYGNLDQMNFFVPYVFNAGATVVAFRPIGYQTNEVVLDNDSRGVKFSGKWFNSRSTVFYGRTGAVPYRFALLDKTETATATYTPRIPVAGFYPVYAWVRHGPDRTSQLYRVLHTGGQTLVRVPHHKVGSGWVYLGTYYFEAGAARKRGAVIVSNLQPSPGFGAVAVADAIRFGNGMGDIVPEPGGRVSGYPREEEASLYWVRKSLGQGQTNVLFLPSGDQTRSNVSAPLRGAREMIRKAAGSMFERVFLSFHSNSGGGRGAIGLWNNPELFPGTKTPNQQRLAQLVAAEVTNTLCPLTVPPLEVPWFRRGTLTYARDDYAFGEINNRVIGDAFDATILEVAFHDSNDDAKLLRDPKVRDLVGRCSYQAIVRYLHEFDALPVRFLPEPPRNPRVTSTLQTVCVAWDEPADAAQNAVEGYLVYRSGDGYGFGRPERVGAGQTSLTLPRLPSGREMYFRVTAVNGGGESLPSAVVGCRPAKTEADPRVLLVNGFTQFDRFNNPRQTPVATNYVPPSAIGAMDRVIPRLNNSFDYVVPHGQALAARGAAFDSCQREAVAQAVVPLEKYEAVIWGAGRQTTNLFIAAEQQALDRYVSHGGNLLVSGAHVDPRSAEVHFGANPLRSQRAETSRRTGGAPLVLSECAGPAARGKVVSLGCPFESISPARARSRCMARVLRVFAFRPPRQVVFPEVTRNDEGASLEWRSVPGRKYQLQVNDIPGGVLWQNLGRPVVAGGLSVTWRDGARRESPCYRVLVLN